jgi:chromosomal replication initiator protein
LDGPAVVNGVFTIPLPGHASNVQSPVSNVQGMAHAWPHRLGEFIAGPENTLAATALRPYLDGTATEYNPLVLYGPHGSGKSHLAHGLAAWWHQHFPAAGVLCLHASEFAEAYASALADQRLESWRQQVRGTALLIVEDLGQLSGKRGAQQELLYALDAMTERGALVVVTARSLPTHSPVLLRALRSRLSAGLAVPLALPGTTARRAILERVTIERGLSLPKRAVRSLAEGLPVSVPELISAVLELELTAQITPGAVDPASVRQFIKERGIAKMPTLRDVALLTAKYFGLKLSDLKSPLRRQPLVAARGVAMYLARQLTDKSLEQIGAFFGGRDHTTVLYGLGRIEKMLRRDRGTRQAVAELKKLLVAS